MLISQNASQIDACDFGVLPPTYPAEAARSARGGMSLSRQLRELHRWRSVCMTLCGDPTHPPQLTWTTGIRRCSTQPAAAANRRQGPLLGLKVLLRYSRR